MDELLNEAFRLLKRLGLCLSCRGTGTFCVSCHMIWDKCICARMNYPSSAEEIKCTYCQRGFRPDVHDYFSKLEESGQIKFFPKAIDHEELDPKELSMRINENKRA